MTNYQSCQDRVESALASRIITLEKLWTAYQEGDEERYKDELGTFFEYGLCFDYVPFGLFSDQQEGYFRYQLGYGGPSDEFRFYTDASFHCHTIKYWFLDWFDGAHIDLSGSEKELLLEIFECFKEIGSVEIEFKKSED